MDIPRSKRKDRDEPDAQDDAPIEGRVSTDKKGRTAASAGEQRESEAAAPARPSPLQWRSSHLEDLLPDDESRALWHTNPTAVREKMRAGLHQVLLANHKRIGVKGVRELAGRLSLMHNAHRLSTAQHDVLFDLLGEELHTQKLRQALFEQLRPDVSFMSWPEGRTVERVTRLLGYGLATVLGDKLVEFVLALPHAESGDCACLGFFRALHPDRQAATIIHIAEQLAARAHSHNGADVKLRLLVSALGGNAMEPALLQGICTRLRDPTHHANINSWLPGLSAGLSSDGQPNLSMLRASLLARPGVSMQANALLLGAATPHEALGKVLATGMRDVLPNRPEPAPDFQRLVHGLAQSCSRETLQQTVEQHARTVAQRLPSSQGHGRGALLAGLADAWVGKQLPLLSLAHLLTKPLSTGAVLVVLTWHRLPMIDIIVRELADTPLEAPDLDALVRALPRPPAGVASDARRYADDWFKSLVRQIGLTPQPALVQLLQRVIASVGLSANTHEVLALQLAQATLEGVAAVGRALGQDAPQYREPYQQIDWFLTQLMPRGLSPANYSALLESTIAGIRETGSQQAAIDRNIARALALLRASVGEGPHAGLIDDLGRGLAGEAGWAQACRLRITGWNHPLRFSLPTEDFPAERMDSLMAAATSNPAAGPLTRPTTADLDTVANLRRPQYDFHDWVAEGVTLGLRCVAAGMSEADCAPLLAHRLQKHVCAPDASMMDEIRLDPITAGLLLAWKPPIERALEMVLQRLVPVRGTQEQILSILRTGVASVAWLQPGARDAIAAHAFKALVRIGVSAEAASPSAFAMFDACITAAGASRQTAVRALASPPFDIHDYPLRNQLLADLVRTQPEQAGREALVTTIATGWSEAYLRPELAMQHLAATQPGRKALLKAGRALEISQLMGLARTIRGVTGQPLRLALMAQLPRSGDLLTAAQVARWSLAISLAHFQSGDTSAESLAAAKAAFSVTEPGAQASSTEADPALLQICHQSCELAAKPWRVAAHPQFDAEGGTLMKTIYTSTLRPGDGTVMEHCLELADDASIAPARRLAGLADLVPVSAPRLTMAEFVYLGRQAIGLLDEHHAEQAREAAAGEQEGLTPASSPAAPRAHDRMVSALAAGLVHHVLIVCEAFENLDDVAWVYEAASQQTPLDVADVQACQASLRRHLRDLDALLARRRAAVSTPGSAPANPSPQRLLANLMQVLHGKLSAPLLAALALLPAPVTVPAVVPPGTAVDGALALLLQADPPAEAARLDHK